MRSARALATLSFSVAAVGVALGCGSSELDLPRPAGSSAAGAGGTTTSSSASQNATSTAAQAAVGSTNVGVGVGGGASGSVGSGGEGGVATTGIGGSANVAVSNAVGIGGGPSCAPLGDPCTACLSPACPATYCNCVDDAECLKVIECSNGCNGDAMCKQGCLTAHPSGISEATLLSDCAATDCAVACPNSGKPLTPCTKCLLESCQAEANACLADPECLALYDCLSGCPSLDRMCQQKCYTVYGAGTGTLQPLLMCSKQECVPSCN